MSEGLQLLQADNERAYTHQKLSADRERDPSDVYIEAVACPQISRQNVAEQERMEAAQAE